MAKANLVFQIGFNRCGTTSIADYLRRGGFRVADCTLPDGDRAGQHIALVMKQNLETSRPILSDLEHFNGFTDMEFTSEHLIVEAYKWFHTLASEAPEARFILNTRDVENWIESRLNFVTYAARYSNCLGLADDKVADYWRADWEQHVERVRQILPADRLFELNIDAPDEEGLATFLGLGGTIAFRQRNKRPRGRVSPTVARYLPQAILNRIPNRIKNAAKNI